MGLNEKVWKAQATEAYEHDRGFTRRADELTWIITSRPVWWKESGYPPPTPHDQHLYDDGCAICKAGHAPWALRLVIDAVLNADSMRQAGRIEVSYPSEPSPPAASGAES